MKNKKIYLDKHEQFISLDTLVGKIATYIYIECSNNTSTGNWTVTEYEIEQDLELPNGIVKELVNEVKNKLETTWSEQVADIETYQDDDSDEGIVFDIVLYHEYISGFIQDDACYLSEEEPKYD